MSHMYSGYICFKRYFASKCLPEILSYSGHPEFYLSGDPGALELRTKRVLRLTSFLKNKQVSALGG